MSATERMKRLLLEVRETVGKIRAIRRAVSQQA